MDDKSEKPPGNLTGSFSSVVLAYCLTCFLCGFVFYLILVYGGFIEHSDPKSGTVVPSREFLSSSSIFIFSILVGVTTALASLGGLAGLWLRLRLTESKSTHRALDAGLLGLMGSAVFILGSFGEYHLLFEAGVIAGMGLIVAALGRRGIEGAANQPNFLWAASTYCATCFAWGAIPYLILAFSGRMEALDPAGNIVIDPPIHARTYLISSLLQGGMLMVVCLGGLVGVWLLGAATKGGAMRHVMNSLLLATLATGIYFVGVGVIDSGKNHFLILGLAIAAIIAMVTHLARKDMRGLRILANT